MKTIIAKDVGVEYKVYHEKHRSLKELVLNALRSKGGAEEFWALRNVSFEVGQSDVLGVIGKNGAGKSTLLLVLSGILQPDEGRLELNAKASTLLSIGAGFKNDLSGKDNVYLNGAFLGFSQKEIDSKYQEIVRFADIGDFIDVPVKKYSSGMKARLGFAIAANVEPDILLLDEILGVGDAAFREKSQKKIRELMNKAKTVVIVTHEPNFVKEYCTKAVWLNQGKIASMGDPDKVVNDYLEFIEKEKKLSEDRKSSKVA